VTLEEIWSGIGESIANARPDVKQEHADLLRALEEAVQQRKLEQTMAILERLDIVDHYPAVRRPDGRLEPQPMPGGWTSWYGWMTRLRGWEATPYLAAMREVAKPDIPEAEIKRSIW
jgi:hypothetical protein